MFSWYPTEETMTMRASGCARTMRSAASMPSICGMVMSIRTMSGVVRSYSVMAVQPSPASPAISPPKDSTILATFLRAKTESSTTRYRIGLPSLRIRIGNVSICLFSLQLQLDSYSSSNLFRIALHGQRIGQHVQRDHAHRVTTLNGGFRHAEDRAGILALRNRQRARVFHQSQAIRSVITHAGH